MTTAGIRKVAPVLLWLFSIVYLSLGGWLAYQDRVSAATLCVAAAVLLLLLANLDKLEHFKGLGIEAKMRQLDQRINEADELLKHISNLSRAMGQLTFEMLSKVGRWSEPPSRAKSLEIAKTLKRHLEAIGVDAAEIESAMEPWHRMNISDLSLPVLSEIKRVLSEYKQHWDKELAQYPVPLDTDDPKHRHITDMQRCYGRQIGQLERRWESDVCDFLVHVDEIIRALTDVSDADKSSLLEITKADRAAVAHYVKTKRFLSEDKWLEGQPENG